MKKLILFVIIASSALFAACQKEKKTATAAIAATCPENPKTTVGANLQGNWMYGNFSLTEYWSQNPNEYLGPALQYAVAFKFNADGSYDQYFTSSSVSAGIATYQQSVTKGTVVIDEAGKVIKTYACSAHYKRTRSGQIVEERDLGKNELTLLSTYYYTTGTEPSGTKAIYLTLQGTASPLTFLQKF